MKYAKTPIAIPEQINRLKERGLIFGSESLAEKTLLNINYYRLRAYTYPFQDNDNKNHPFIESVSFEQILELYSFDGKLRILIFEAIEKIEIALRTQIICNFSLTYGSHWHLKPELYKNPVRFANQIGGLQREIDRSNEAFIEHYRGKYTLPKEPPCWMGLEVSSMGLLSKIFQNLKNENEKRKVTKHFGLKDEGLVENWLHGFSTLRNICAHHGRVWNRRFIKIPLPRNPIYPFLKNKEIHQNKIYALLSCINYVLKIAHPSNTFGNTLKGLIEDCAIVKPKDMGFPPNWQDEPLWK